jgi:hypothetical protein
MLTVPIYIGIISRIRGIEDRVSFSQIVNPLACEGKIIEESTFTTVTDIPAGHILLDWISHLQSDGWWMPWMDEATEITLYVGEYREGETESIPAIQ